MKYLGNCLYHGTLTALAFTIYTNFAVAITDTEQVCFEKLVGGHDRGAVKELLLCRSSESNQFYDSLCYGEFIDDNGHLYRVLQFHRDEPGAWQTSSREAESTPTGLLFSSDQSVFMGSKNISEVDADFVNKTVTVRSYEKGLVFNTLKSSEMYHCQ